VTIQNRLYTIVRDENDPKGQMVKVEPTEYLAKLKPHEAITELKSYVESLAADLEECAKEDLEIQTNVERVQKLLFELEVAQGYLAQVFESWKAAQKVDTRNPGQ
jgi:hypothetical protein